MDPYHGVEDPEELAFQRLFGPWKPFDVRQVSEVLAGWEAPWWVCGGHAVEAFTGVGRPHDDVDVGFFARDLDSLRHHLGGRFHLWSAGNRTLRPVDDRHPALHPDSSQVWLREHALAPWVADLLATPGDPGHYRLRFDEDAVLPLDQATFLHDDGVRYLAPSIVLAYKARLMRPKDRQDFDACLPLLCPSHRSWLAAVVSRLDAAHPWLPRLTG